VSATPTPAELMRLTIINQFYKPDHSPTATLAASLAEHRATLGDEVTVIAGKGGYIGGEAAGAPTPGPGNVRILRVWTPGLGKASHLKRLIDYAAFYLFAIYRVLALPRQDVIITLTTPPLIAWAGLLHKRLRGGRTRLVLWNMDCYPDVAERAGVMKPGGIGARFVRARTRSIFRGLDHLVCLDTAMAELLCAQYAGAQPGLPVSIIPNWEDASLFPTDADPEPHPIYRQPPAAGRAVVLYMGNMGYGHNFDTVLSAADMLRDQPVIFLFVGGGRMWQEVKDEAQSRGLSNILMHRYIPTDERLPMMAGALCALVTLRNEALGVMSPSKIHSNLAMGLPLAYVGPRGSNVDDAIQNHGCGASLRHGDAEGLAAFLTRLLSEPAEREPLRRRARAAFVRSYCDRATLPRFDAVVNHAMGSAGLVEDIPTGTAADYAAHASRPDPATSEPLAKQAQPVGSPE
jgi:colanic acid biosynthesis glycosyl transferase WcaI